MDSSAGSRDSAAGRSGSERGAESSSGGRSELLLYLTCLPERYRTAKFSLAAYLLCWALLRWYQKLKCQSAPLQKKATSSHSGYVNKQSTKKKEGVSKVVFDKKHYSA
ncbi:unnamed protein product [Pleuronectes platessa]|uniref:Uncharacterized protein n=1 Tax=Pleuronectes platessa TaxID=8262 RepID=A0A9N7VLU9_PLEPL|nr:unnamed protein product [Pleuronectes platessa]